MAKSDFKWDSKSIEILEKMWGRNMDPEDIASAIGTSRNSVTGKATRLGLPPRRSKGAGPTEKKNKGLSIMQLERHHCRYIIEDGSYCGKDRISGSSYCAHHHKRCTTRNNA